ncbi:AsmA-like C-terminal region-containing protein [Asaia sp. HN010]|uniref:AsmA-like C-terminal region-containing protein n=1 Tax=Asaia sp. HN010 TaxID=3081233 RepID=UPI0030194992
MPHDFFHRASWRAFRLGALVVTLPLAFLLVAGAAFLWRLSAGPLDVTGIARHFTPVAVQAGQQPDHPAGRLTWDRVFLSWQPGLKHVHPLLIVEARGLRILRQDGSATLAARDARMALRMAPLLRGAFEPTRLDIDTARIILRRTLDGNVDLDWPGAVHRPSRSGGFSIAFLHSLTLHDVTAVLRDAVPGHDQASGDLALRFTGARLDRPVDAAQTGWFGKMNGTFGPAAEPRMPFEALGVAGQDGGASWQAALGPVMPTLFAGLLPHSQAWHVPVALDVQFQLLPPNRAGKNAWPMPDATLLLRLGKGTIDQKDDQPLQISEGIVTAHFALQGKESVIDGVQAGITLVDDLGHPTHFAAGGTLHIDSLTRARQIDGQVSASATTLDVPHMAAIWPRIVMKGARRWVTRNLTQGTGKGLSIAATIRSETGWEHLRPVQTSASLEVDDTTVHWLRPIPPAEDVSARFSFAGPDTLKIDFLGGAQPSSDARNAPRLHLDGGSMLISDLLAHDQMGTISLALSGDLAAHLALLAHPRLHLLSRHPLPFTHPSGPVVVTGQISLPLSSHIENDQIHVTAEARFENVALGNVVLGRDLTGASGTMKATERHLSLDGSGLLDNVPTTARLEENFLSRDGGLREQVHAVSVFDEAALEHSHIGSQSLFKGRAQLVADYKARFDGHADLLLALNLADAALTIPVWRKMQGDEATASAHIGLRDGHVAALDQISAEGPGLHVEGRGQVTEGQVRSLALDNFVIGRSNGDAVIELPSFEGAPINVHVHAHDLDLAPLLHGDDKKEKSARTPLLPTAKPAAKPPVKPMAKSAPEMRWNVDLATDRLFYSPTGSFGGVVAHLEHRNNRLETGHFSARQPVAVKMQLMPRGTGRYLQLDVENLGMLLNQTGMTARLEGGKAQIAGHVGDGGAGQLPPFDGVISVSPFTFMQPPAALTAATHLSVFNWSQASEERFEVQHLRLPVKISNDVMTIREGHLGNPALGATLEGKIGLDQGKLDLQGTVVPVFGINAAPGRLPNVGKLFSPEKGGGLLAATFTVTGTASNPTLSVNPFAMLLPGVMRQLAK